jgi:RNA polymerase sigma-70 factor (ECF subfamily)
VNDKTRFLASLFDAQRLRLERFIARRIRGRQDIADVAQDVYVRILGIKDVDAIRNPAAYLFTVADNVIKERAVLDRRRALSVDVDDQLVQHETAVLSFVDSELDDAKAAARLREVLEQLSPKCRAAVLLQYEHGLSYREIGARLGVSTNMVKKYLSYALAHCRRRMMRLG